MEFAGSSSIRNWLKHTFIVLILAMIPSLLLFQASASRLTLIVISPFWQYSSYPFDGGLSFTLYPIILLLAFAISVPSYMLLFLRRHIPRSTSILKYAIIMAAFTVLISSSIVHLWQFVVAAMPYVSYRESTSLEWFGSLVLVFLIVLPSLKWELTRYLSDEKRSGLSSPEEASMQGICNPERAGRLLFYVATLVPYAYQSSPYAYESNPIFLGSVFYSLSLSNSSASGLSIAFHGHPSFIVPLVLTVLALRFLFVYRTVAYILGRERDHIVVIIGLLSLIPDTISMPLTLPGLPFRFGPFPLLFTAGLLTMYKCYVRK
jgi:hypothetical protein